MDVLPSRRDQRGRRHAQAGIALGPILFIIAILAVVAGVIASTTGVFSTASGSEKARMHANAIIEQGTQVKLGVERMTANGIVVGTTATTCGTFSATAPELYLIYDASNSSCVDYFKYALFDSRGGGVTRPHPPAEALPVPNQPFARYAWHFIKDADITGVGVASKDFIAAIEVTRPVCEQINAVLFGTDVKDGTADLPPTSNKAPADLTTMLMSTSATATDLTATGALNVLTGGFANGTITAAASPAATVTAVSNRSEGCFQTATNARYVYYKVLNGR